MRIRPDTAGFQGETQSGVVGTMKKVAVAAAAAFASVKVFDFAKSAVAEAAQTQKSLENVQQSFGGLSKGIVGFADTAAQNFGISRQASLSFASSLAVSARNLGLSRAEAAKETVGYQQLAGSLGSIKGIDPASVFDKLSLAMLGNTRGLKSLGIAFSTAQQKQEALRLGIKGQSADWTEAQKAQVIYGLATSHLGQFMDQAKKHSGDLIDVQHRLTAEWANAKEEVGAVLLPILEKLGGFLADNLPTAFRLIGDVAHAAGRTIVAVWTPIVNAFRPVVEQIQITVNQFNDLRRAGLSISGALRATLIDVLTRLGVSFGTAQTAVNDVSTALAVARDAIIQYGTAILGTLAPLANLRADLEAITGFVKDHQEAFIALAAGVAAAAAAWVVYTAAMAAATVAQNIAAASLALLNAVLDANPVVLITLAIVGLVAALVYLYRNNETVRKDLQESWVVIKTVIVDAVGVIRAVVTTTADVVRGVWDRFGASIMAITRTVWGIIKAVIQGDLKIIQGIIDVVLGVLHGNWSQVWHGIVEITRGVVGIIVAIIRGLAGLLLTLGRQAITGLLNGMQSVFGSVIGFVKSIPGRVLGAVGNLGKALFNAGVSLIEGLISGITSKIGAVKDTLTGLASSVTSWKGPPEKDRVLLTPAGQLLMQGFMSGIESQRDKLRGQLQGITRDVASTRFGALPQPAVAGVGQAPGGDLVAVLRRLADRPEASGVTINGPLTFHTDAHSFASLERDALNRSALRVRR